jgi:hypothetical protein
MVRVRARSSPRSRRRWTGSSRFRSTAFISVSIPPVKAERQAARRSRFAPAAALIPAFAVPPRAREASIAATYWSSTSRCRLPRACRQRARASTLWPSGRPPRQAHRGDSRDVLKSIERYRCLRPRVIAGLDSKVIASRSSAAAAQGNSRMLRFLNSTGDPSDSRQRNPEWGSQPVPPETSSPLTQSLISPLIPRT